VAKQTVVPHHQEFNPVSELFRGHEKGYLLVRLGRKIRVFEKTGAEMAVCFLDEITENALGQCKATLLRVLGNQENGSGRRVH